MTKKKELEIINTIPVKKKPVKKIEPSVSVIPPVKIKDFEPIVITTIEYKLNYVSILQKLRKLSIIKKKLMNVNLWTKYCNWWNNKFNKITKDISSVSEIEELYEDVTIEDLYEDIFESDK